MEGLQCFPTGFYLQKLHLDQHFGRASVSLTLIFRFHKSSHHELEEAVAASVFTENSAISVLEMLGRDSKALFCRWYNGIVRLVKLVANSEHGGGIGATSPSQRFYSISTLITVLSLRSDSCGITLQPFGL